MIDIDKLYKHSMDFVIKAEERFFSMTVEEQKASIADFNKRSTEYDLDKAHALWIMPNSNEYLFQVCNKLDLQKDDVLLDIGAGDGRLSIIALQEDGIKKAYAIELDRKWFCNTLDLIWKRGAPDTLYYGNQAWQDYKFPKEITKCAFIAWHNGPMTRQAVIDKLKKTNCELFVHNFGDQGLLQTEILKCQEEHQ